MGKWGKWWNVNLFSLMDCCRVYQELKGGDEVVEHNPDEKKEGQLTIVYAARRG